MSDLLDIRTLLITALVTYGVCAGAIAFLRWKIPSIPGLGHFLLGTLISIPALLIYAGAPDRSIFLSGVVANYLSVLAAALHLDGILRFYGRAPKPSVWTLSIPLIPLYAFWTLSAPNTEYRVIAVIAPMAVLCFAISWTAASRSRGDERVLSLLIVLGFGAFGSAFLARLASMSWNPWAAIMDVGTPSTASTFVLSNIAMISGTLGLALVATQRLVQDLEASREAAEAGSRAKTEFLAVMSHEIRTPMNGVLGAAGLILNTPAEKRIHRYAETIDTSGKAMLRILDEILDFSKIEAKGLVLESIPFDLQAEVESTAVAFREAADLKGLALNTEIDESIARLNQGRRVIGDPGRLRQILSNLISNALKFTDSGAIDVRIRADAEEVDPDRFSVVFEVSDTGPGIKPEMRETLFQPFKQADASTTRRFGGTGLGLAICRDLVTSMGGTIGARGRSQEDLDGSTFWFRIPFTLAEPTEFQDPLSDPSLFLTEARGKPARILAAEDNAINRFIIIEMLEELGHTVEIAKNGKEALDAVRSSPFDLVFMDCRMPEMDGFEATRRIRSQDIQPRIPIIAVTATALEDDHQECLNAGMNAVLVKPISTKDLYCLLDLWLPQSGDKAVSKAAR